VPSVTAAEIVGRPTSTPPLVTTAKVTVPPFTAPAADVMLAESVTFCPELDTGVDAGTADVVVEAGTTESRLLVVLAANSPPGW
jgi:hypothetical protein